MLRRALADFPLELLDRAVTLLEADVLYRSEKVLGVATWFRDLQRNLGVKGIRRSDTRDNLIWRAVATAPPGFCHVRSSMIGTLLEDLAAGMSIDEVTWRFAEKMHPLRYQRPQVAPSAGNIARAEEIVAKLGIASSLKRRFARADEIEAIWTPAPSPAPVGSGVFGHIKPKDAAPTLVPMRLPQRPITWAKFRDEVLPKAHALRYYTGSGGQPFAALTTAVDPDAPPILQWDHADRRNPVAWFFRHPEHAQTPEAWGLAACTWTRVTAVAYKPCMWGADPSSSTHHGRGVLFVLDGCEVPNKAGGLALFPECLASSLREVRSTIEAYSQKGTLEDIGGPYACGIMVNEGATWLVPLEVDTGDGTLAEYLLDRWD